MVVLYANTLGTRIASSVRKYSSVATSLAVTKWAGTTGSGILMIARWPCPIAMKTLFEAPSAIFGYECYPCGVLHHGSCCGIFKRPHIKPSGMQRQLVRLIPQPPSGGWVEDMVR
jgi:hypothetical protein